MIYKKIKLKACDIKMCTILLFTLFSFFILDFSYLDYENLVYETSFENNYWDYYYENPFELDRNISWNTKSHIDKSFDTISLSDTMIKNAFVAFKFVKDQDGNDNDGINIFSKLKNEYITLDNGVFDLAFDINIFTIKFWYRMMIWLVLSVLFIESIAISILNIIYIHKSDGKKRNIVSIYLSAI